MPFNCIFYCGYFDSYHSGLARSVLFFVPVYIVKLSTVQWTPVLVNGNGKHRNLCYWNQQCSWTTAAKVHWVAITKWFVVIFFIHNSYHLNVKVASEQENVLIYECRVQYLHHMVQIFLINYSYHSNTFLFSILTMHLRVPSKQNSVAAVDNFNEVNLSHIPAVIILNCPNVS